MGAKAIKKLSGGQRQFWVTPGSSFQHSWMTDPADRVCWRWATWADIMAPEARGCSISSQPEGSSFYGWLASHDTHMFSISAVTQIGTSIQQRAPLKHVTGGSQLSCQDLLLMGCSQTYKIRKIRDMHQCFYKNRLKTTHFSAGIPRHLPLVSFFLRTANSSLILSCSLFSFMTGDAWFSEFRIYISQAPRPLPAALCYHCPDQQLFEGRNAGSDLSSETVPKMSCNGPRCWVLHNSRLYNSLRCGSKQIDLWNCRPSLGPWPFRLFFTAAGTWWSLAFFRKTLPILSNPPGPILPAQSHLYLWGSTNEGLKIRKRTLTLDLLAFTIL